MLRLLGLCCYGFAILDLGLYYTGTADITGVSWSPIAAGLVGSALVRIGAEPDAGPVEVPPIQEHHAAMR